MRQALLLEALCRWYRQSSRAEQRTVSVPHGMHEYIMRIFIHICPQMRLAVGGTLQVVQAVIKGRAENNFCAT